MVGLIACLWFSIPAGDATETLNEWSRQADLQVLFDFSALRGTETPRILGEFPPERALSHLLENSGFHGEMLNDHTFGIIETTKPMCKPWMGASAPLPPCIQRKVHKI